MVAIAYSCGVTLPFLLLTVSAMRVSVLRFCSIVHRDSPNLYWKLSHVILYYDVTNIGSCFPNEARVIIYIVINHLDVESRSFNYEGSIISDDVTKATCFNNYFSSVFTNEDKTFLPSLRSTIVWGLDLITTINFAPHDVLDVLTTLNESKACGPDVIPARLLKEGAESICTTLAHLFQMSLDSGTRPSD